MSDTHEQTSDPPEAVLDRDAHGEQPDQAAAAEVERHQRRGGGAPS